MRALLLATTMITAAAACGQNPTARIAIVGEFSNMRYTEEHAYGYTVQLWRQGDALFGFFLASYGLAGDTPAGMLEQLQIPDAGVRTSGG